MRITLYIQDEVLNTAKRLAARQGKSVDEVISSLARQALRGKGSPKRARNGVPLLPMRPARVTPEVANQLRDMSA